MEPSIKDISWMGSAMGKALRFGQMEQSTKENGKIIRQTEKELSGMLMETSTRANGSMTKQLAREFTHM